jgi:hypothetical protein
MSFIKEMAKDIGSVALYVGMAAGIAVSTSGCTNYQKTPYERSVEYSQRAQMLNRNDCRDTYMTPQMRTNFCKPKR